METITFSECHSNLLESFFLQPYFGQSYNTISLMYKERIGLQVHFHTENVKIIGRSNNFVERYFRDFNKPMLPIIEKIKTFF